VLHPGINDHVVAPASHEGSSRRAELRASPDG